MTTVRAAARLSPLQGLSGRSQDRPAGAGGAVEGAASPTERQCHPSRISTRGQAGTGDPGPPLLRQDPAGRTLPNSGARLGSCGHPGVQIAGSLAAGGRPRGSLQGLRRRAATGAPALTATPQSAPQELRACPRLLFPRPVLMITGTFREVSQAGTRPRGPGQGWPAGSLPRPQGPLGPGASGHPAPSQASNRSGSWLWASVSSGGVEVSRNPLRCSPAVRRIPGTAHVNTPILQGWSGSWAAGGGVGAEPPWGSSGCRPSSLSSGGQRVLDRALCMPLTGPGWARGLDSPQCPGWWTPGWDRTRCHGGGGGGEQTRPAEPVSRPPGSPRRASSTSSSVASCPTRRWGWPTSCCSARA